MDITEAEKIFKWWQSFVEFADKFACLQFPIPDSFFAYPTETLEEALNIIVKSYSHSGNLETSKAIKATMARHLLSRKEDEEALEDIRKHLTLISENPYLKKTIIENLHNSRDAYRKGR